MNTTSFWRFLSKKQWIVFGASLALILLSGGWLVFAKTHIDWISTYYTYGIYQTIVTVLSTINGLFPFSIAEFLLLLAIIVTLLYLVSLGRVIACHRARLKTKLLQPLVAIALIFAICAVQYLPNYYNYSFAYYSGLTVEDSSVDDLYLLCVELAQQANNLREAVDQPDQVFTYSTIYTDAQLFTVCADAYQNLIADYPDYDGLFDPIETATAKAVTLSEVMSYLKITGFFFPITAEANINVNTSAVYIPATVCHELAHVAGFMREDEANFIAYLVCRSSDDVLLNYSGTMLALLHAGNALYSANSELYWEFQAMLSDDVMLDINAHSAYYQAYDTSIGDLSRAVNDTYLKANDQQDGVDSYGNMVDLLIAEYKSRQ